MQPCVKVRGREYPRIIYGPDYMLDENLTSLRSLGCKRALALREYALGFEALQRVACGEPIWRVNECVFAVLALESEPLDPRLWELFRIGLRSAVSGASRRPYRKPPL